METLWQDLKYGVRMLARSPGFTAVAVLTLALGIGATTAIFSVVNAVVLRPLPVADPQELAVVLAKDEGRGLLGGISYPNYQFYRENNEVFSDLAVQVLTQVNLSGEGRAERAWIHVVSANYFALLGLPPGLGRTFSPDEDQSPGGQPVIVLGHGFWQRAFGGDPAIVGKTVRINGHPLKVIGVVPRPFRGMEWGVEIDAYVPLAMIEQARPGWQALLQARTVRVFRAVGRLRSGMTVEQANAAMNVLARQLAQQYPETGRTITLTVIPETWTRPSPYAAAYVLPLAALFMTLVCLVLLIACANVASLLLARATARETEMAIRAAVGAGRYRLVRQVVTETVLLGLMGGAAGLGLAVWGTAGLGAAVTTAVASAVPVVYLDLDPDFRVYAFALLVALGAGAAAGLIPALRTSRTDPQQALKEGGRGLQGPGRHRLRSVLVVGQVAVSVVLLICAGLFVRSLQYASRKDVGFQPENLFTMALDPVLQGYDLDRCREFYQMLLERVRALPGVEAAAVSPFLPFRGGFATAKITVPGLVAGKDEDLPTVWKAVVSEDYFSTLGIPIVEGRSFNVHDTDSSQRVVIVNETMARQFWPDEDALGKQLSVSGPQGPFLEVVGVAKDGMYLLLDERSRPFMYEPAGQGSIGFARLYVRTGANPAGLVGAVRAQVRGLDPTMPVFHVSTLGDELNATAFLPVRLGALLVGSLGALGLALASLGMYGVIFYSVSQRSHEIGVRIAMGAQPHDVLRLVLRQGVLLTAAGGTAGLVAAYALAGLLSAFLVGVRPSDPITYAAVPLVLGAVAAVACWVPARRATRVDPMVALRYE